MKEQTDMQGSGYLPVSNMSQTSSLTAVALANKNAVYKYIYIQIIFEVIFFRSLYRYFMYIRGAIDNSRTTYVC